MVLALPGPVQADVHNDEKLGFSIQVPNGWLRTALAGDEQWIVAKYRSDREYVGKKERLSHTPDMNVVLIPHQAAKAPEASVGKEEDGTTVVTVRSKAYKDYKAWLADHSPGGGYFFSAEEETTVNGVKTTCYEIKIEKLTIPRRIVAWVFHGDDADYAVQFEGLEDYWDKLGKDFVLSLKSFKLFQRKGTLPTATGERKIEIDEPGKKRTPEEEAKRRDDKFQTTLRKSVEALTQGWTRKNSKNYVAISHVDDKYTQKVIDQAEAVRGWLEANLGWIGEGKPGPMIIRVCADLNEEQSFRSGSAGWFEGGFEITTHKDVSSGKASFEFEWLNQRVMGMWLREKNRTLAGSMPGWLNTGLQRFVATGIMKQGKIDFRSPEYEMYRLRAAAKNAKLAGVHDLLTADNEKLGSYENPQTQSATLVRYLLEGPGAKAPRTKDSFRTYVNALLAFVKEQEAKDASGDGGPAMAGAATEEEGDAQYKKRAQMWKEKEKELLDAVLKSTFGSWTETDWKAVEASYMQFVD